MAKVAIVILNWNGQKMLAKYLPNVVEYSRQDAAPHCLLRRRDLD